MSKVSDTKLPVISFREARKLLPAGAPAFTACSPSRRTAGERDGGDGEKKKKKGGRRTIVGCNARLGEISTSNNKSSRRRSGG